MSDLGENAAVTTNGAPDLDLAFAAALAARRETFLALLPRKFKIFIASLLLLAAVGFVIGNTPHAPPVELDSKETDQETHAGTPHGAEQSVEEPTKTPAEIIQLKTEAERAAAAMNDGTDGQATVRLAPAPDPALVEETTAGQLPRVSQDRRKPWQVYARPFNYQDPRPRIAIVMMDLGGSRVATDAALRRLPPTVTFSFDVQAKAVDEWLARARLDGHETLLSLPMEPFDYPQSDPGPNALLTTLPNADNVQRLLTALKVGAGYVGVTTSSGSRFLSNSPKLMPIIEVLRDRGLMILDSKIATRSVVSSLATELSVPSAASSREIDSTPDPDSIDKALSQLEQTARVEGVAVGIASPLPVTMERLEVWTKGLSDRGLVLAPVSSVVR